MDAVRFEDFSYHYPKTGKGLNRVMLAIPAGSFTVLTGANGSGKTTLCMAMTGLVPHFFGGSMSGRVLVDGQDTAGRPVADIAAGVGLVMEDYESQLVALTVWDEVAFALENMAVPPALIRERVLAALASVGLTGLEERELSALSADRSNAWRLRPCWLPSPNCWCWMNQRRPWIRRAPGNCMRYWLS